MPKTYPTIKIVQRTKNLLDGTRNIFIRLTIDRKCKYFPLNVYTRPDHFKPGYENTVSRSDIDHHYKNSLIDHSYMKAKKILFDYRIEDKVLTFDRFQNEFYNKSYGSKSFYDFFERQIELLTGKLEPASINNYKFQLSKLKEFRHDLTFNDITIDFITSYEGFLKRYRQNNKNTVIKSITIIKSIMNKAVENGIIKDNPIKDYKLGRIEGDRQFLSQDELHKLEQLYFNGTLKENKSNVLRYFLFCCYTGLRYQDIKKLRFKDIQDGQYLYLKMTKTKEFVRIPLTEKAKKLIPSGSFENQTVFKVQTDQPTNRKLKEIMKIAGITKLISFHCARHTFATVSKSLGMDYDVISKILGHTDRKTTQIYAKYEMNFLSKEMERWNEAE